MTTALKEKTKMVEGYNGKSVKSNFIHTGEGCKHSLSKMVPKLNKCICCLAHFYFFFLSDNEISWVSYVPNYVQFLTAQHSYSETAVKSNVGVTQIKFFFSTSCSSLGHTTTKVFYLLV